LDILNKKPEEQQDEQIDLEAVQELGEFENNAGELDEKMDQPSVDTEGEDIEEITRELEETRAKADEYLDGWQRARADFANYKKRIEREQADLYQTISGSVVKQYLDIVDDLDLALKNRPQSGEGAEWANGIELVFRKLLTILENQGITPMKVQGEMFDPTLHEAISSEENEEFECDEIIEVVKRGYMMGERVLRPALVRVAR